MLPRIRVLLSLVGVVFLTALIACGGNPSDVPAKSEAALSSGLTITKTGAGAGAVEVRDANDVLLFTCPRENTSCSFDPSAATPPAAPPLTVTGAAAAGSTFVGFNRPYCVKNDCGPIFEEYPDFIPPSPYWVAESYRIDVLPAAATARFVPAPTFKLTVSLSGPGTGTITAAQEGNDVPLATLASPPRLEGYVSSGANVVIAGSANVLFQVPYCVANASLCAAMMASDPEWFPPRPTAWIAGPLTFKMMGAKSVVVYLR